MARRRKNWRGGWLGWVLNIHSPLAHQMEVCWCRGTKREIFPENFYTISMLMADMKAYGAYIDALSTALNNQKEKKKHGEGTGTTS